MTDSKPETAKESIAVEPKTKKYRFLRGGKHMIIKAKSQAEAFEKAKLPNKKTPSKPTTK